jgi:hypothetical protein
MRVGRHCRANTGWLVGLGHGLQHPHQDRLNILAPCPGRPRATIAASSTVSATLTTNGRLLPDAFGSTGTTHHQVLPGGVEQYGQEKVGARVHVDPRKQH